MATAKITSLFLLVALFFSPVANAAPHDEASLLPNDAVLVMQVDFNKLKGTKIFRELVVASPQYAMAMAAAKAKTGIDMNTQLKTMTMGFFNDGKAEPMVLLLEAPFPANSPGLIGPTVAKKDIGGKPYYVVSKKSNSVAPYQGRILLGTEERVRAILSGKPGLSAALSAQSSARDKAAQVWVFGAPPSKMMKQGAEQIKEVSSLNVALDMAKGLRLIAEIKASPALATKAVAMYEQQKAQMSQNPMFAAMGLGAAINNMKVSANGGTLSVNLALSDAEVGQMINMLKMMMTMRQKAPSAPMGNPAMPAMPKPTPMPAVPGQKMPLPTK